jgi:hypothetical protein
MSMAPFFVVASSGIAAIIIIALAIEDGLHGLAFHHSRAQTRTRASLSDLLRFLDSELLYIAAALCALVILLCAWRFTGSIACGVICGATWDLLAAAGVYALGKRRRCNN